MNLLDVIRDLDDFDEEDVIYALEPWSPDTAALVLRIDEEVEGVPEEAARLGLAYFLEIEITREILEGVDALLDPPSIEKRCEVAIYYATYDAWPFWLEEAGERARQERSGWKFTEPGDHPVTTTLRIVGWEDWIARVVHADTGGWAFHGPGNSTAEETAVSVTLEDIFQRDNSVGELGDLPAGWEAWRESQYKPWQRAKITGQPQATEPEPGEGRPI